MGYYYYKIICANNNELIASHLTLENAFILIEGLFNKYYHDVTLKYTIVKEVPNESNDTSLLEE